MIGLSSVTKALRNLIAGGVFEATNLEVLTTSAPVDVAEAGVLSVHLFHAMESPDFKNVPPPRGQMEAPVRHVPMGMILQYVISMRQPSDAENHLSDDQMQDVIGYTARVLHDYPIVDKKLELDIPDVGLSPVLPPELHDQVVEFILRPAKMEETVSFWGSEQNTLPRLSLFVEARVVLLEPSQPPLIPGRVYSIGGGVVASMGPQLLGGKSEQSFALPMITGRTSDTLVASPPRPSLFDSGGSLPTGLLADNNRVEFRAQGLAPFRSLVLSGDGVTVTARIDSVAPPSGPDWEFEVGSDRLGFRVREAIWGTTPDDVTPHLVPIVPGAYSVRILQRDERLAGLTLTSNVCPLTIVAQTLGVTGTSVRTLLVQGSYLEGLESDAVKLMIDGEVYARIPSGPPTERTFSVATVGGDSEVQFVLYAETIPSANHPIAVNLIVNGVPSTPEWLVS